MSVGDCIGKKFNRLTVLDEWYNKENKMTYCKCLCNCGNIIKTRKTSLKNKNTQSCGCLQKEIMSKKLKLYNKYDLTNDYGIGYTSKNEPFYFDLEDYDKIKKYCWHTDNHGYLIADDIKNWRQNIKQHRLIMGLKKGDEKIVDHINRNKLDNRKNNLRLCKHMENDRNKNILKSNKSGIIGVYNNKGKWVARICVNKKSILLGRFCEIKDATIVRLNAELKYFGEFAPQQHLFKEYGIGDEK